MILAADIGGTKTLLALLREGSLEPVLEKRFESAAHGDFPSLLESFLKEEAAHSKKIDAAVFGVAGPVENGACVHVTNLPWTLDAKAIEKRFAIRHVQLLNDFAAAARGLVALKSDQLVTLQAGEPRPASPRVLLGAGTGLGISYLLPDGKGYRVVASEGGHAGFAPSDARQAGLWRRLYEQNGRVEIEDVLSGPGLGRIYTFLTGQADGDMRATPEEVVSRGLAGSDVTAVAALDLFISCFGALAGDHALNVLAQGGVFVAGGIAPKILPRLRAGGFIAAFNDKGAFASHTKSCPVHIVIEERLGLLGAACAAFDLR